LDTKTPSAQAQLLQAQTASLDETFSPEANALIRAGDPIFVTAGLSQVPTRRT
jgi:hypothetical protein